MVQHRCNYPYTDGCLFRDLISVLPRFAAGSCNTFTLSLLEESAADLANRLQVFRPSVRRALKICYHKLYIDRSPIGGGHCQCKELGNSTGADKEMGCSERHICAAMIRHSGEGGWKVYGIHKRFAAEKNIRCGPFIFICVSGNSRQMN